MKPSNHFFTFICVVIAIGFFLSPAYGGAKKMQKNKGAFAVSNGASSMINQLPYEELTADEEISLIRMREEEKLARDVYAALYDIWQAPVFRNISQSEQRHMNAVKVLLDKYELIDPVTDSTAGVFTDPEFSGLYASLMERGNASLAGALTVGATIEDLDINDLQDFLRQTDNQDITAVYENLLQGSRNHLRAFTYQLSLNGETYEARFISPEELEAIITSPVETGRQARKNNAPGSDGSEKGFGKGSGECLNP